MNVLFDRSQICCSRTGSVEFKCVRNMFFIEAVCKLLNASWDLKLQAIIAILTLKLLEKWDWIDHNTMKYYMRNCWPTISARFFVASHRLDGFHTGSWSERPVQQRIWGTFVIARFAWYENTMKYTCCCEHSFTVLFCLASLFCVLFLWFFKVRRSPRSKRRQLQLNQWEVFANDDASQKRL